MKHYDYNTFLCKGQQKNVDIKFLTWYIKICNFYIKGDKYESRNN